MRTFFWEKWKKNFKVSSGKESHVENKNNVWIVKVLFENILKKVKQLIFYNSKTLFKENLSEFKKVEIIQICS